MASQDPRDLPFGRYSDRLIGEVLYKEWLSQLDVDSRIGNEFGPYNQEIKRDMDLMNEMQIHLNILKKRLRENKVPIEYKKNYDLFLYQTLQRKLESMKALFRNNTFIYNVQLPPSDMTKFDQIINNSKIPLLQFGDSGSLQPEPL